MYNVRNADRSDCKAWDDYVTSSPGRTPYHLFAWGETVLHAYGHEVRYLVADSDAGIVGVLPIIEMHRPLLGNTAVSLPFCDLGGPLANTASIAADLKSAARSIPGIGEIEYRENASGNTDETLDKRKVRMILELPDTAEDLLAGFKAKLRSQIKKAQNNGLSYRVVHPCDKQEALAEFYRIFSINMRHLGSPVHGLNWFESLSQAYRERCVLSIIYLGQIAVAGGIILLVGDRASIPWASTISEYNRLSPNMLLYWSLLEYCCDNGIAQFDFGRSTFGEGTYRFKEQWGASPSLLEWYLETQGGARKDIVNSAKKSSLRSTVEVVWRKMPLRLTTSCGPVIRKYISL